jgi:hypothetical protein
VLAASAASQQCGNIEFLLRQMAGMDYKLKHQFEYLPPRLIVFANRNPIKLVE